MKKKKITKKTAPVCSTEKSQHCGGILALIIIFLTWLNPDSINR